MKMNCNDEILIREGDPADLQDLEKLLLQLYISVTDTNGLDKNSIAKNMEKVLQDEHYICFVAVKGNRLIGCIFLYYHQSILHNAPSLMIEEVIVDKDHRNEGIGKRMIQEAIAFAKKSNFAEIEVSTEVANTRAQYFYHSFGFVDRGLLLELEID